MINLQHLDFGYKKTKLLFENLSLDISIGGIYGLLGKNGAGKTTLLKIISGLVFPNKGDCEVLGFCPQKRSPRLLSELYFLPEVFFVPSITIKEYSRLYSSFYPNFNHQLLDALIEELELPRNNLLTHMSFGQKKKFLIAFGIATGCRLFILDEPTNGLDIPSKTQFRKILAANFTDDRIFIISTHQVHDVEKLIDSIIMLDDGKIIFNQSLANVAEHLSFKIQTQEPSASECYYSEKQFGGYITVTDNKANEETDIDLEILFSAILANQDRFHKVFNNRQNC